MYPNLNIAVIRLIMGWDLQQVIQPECQNAYSRNLSRQN